MIWPQLPTATYSLCKPDARSVFRALTNLLAAGKFELPIRVEVACEWFGAIEWAMKKQWEVARTLHW